MAAYHKVEVSLNTNAVEVGIPSPQTVSVTLPNVGPRGEKGEKGDAGSVGATGPQGPAGTGIETLTTKGDLLTRNDTQAIRLGIGSTGQILKVSSSGIPEWGAAPASGVTSVNGESGVVSLSAADLGAAETLHAADHQDGEADQIMASAAIVATSDISLSGVYVPDGTLVAGRLVYYRPGTRKNTKLQFNTATTRWILIKNTFTIAENDEENAFNPWASPWMQTIGGPIALDFITVTQASLEKLARSTTENLGTAALTDSTSFAAASHTHTLAAITDAGTAASKNTPATGNASSTEVVLGSDTRLSDSRTPSSTLAHKSSHAIGGTDVLAPSDLGAQSIFSVESLVITTTSQVNLTAARAKIFDIVQYAGQQVDVKLPSTNAIEGDVFVFRWGTGSDSIRIIQSSSGSPITTVSSGEQKRLIRGSTDAWSLVPVDTHTHAASVITSGTLAHERGGLEADVSAYNGLVKIASGSTSAVTVTSAGEALLDDADAAAQRTTLGAAASGSITTSGLTQATAKLIGRTSSGVGAPEELSASDVRTFLNVADGAESNVQADWNASSGDAQILNKPTLAASATTDTTNASNISSGTLAPARMGSGAPSASNFLRGDGSWQAVSAGVSGSTSTDNAIVRADSTANTVQESALLLDDATTSTQANVAIRNNHSETNSALVLTPKGTGALIGGAKPDGTATGGGNARGARAINLCLSRTAATQVASGDDSIAIGTNATASGANATAIGINANAIAQGTAIGRSAAATGDRSVAIGDQSTANGFDSICIGVRGISANQNNAVALGASSTHAGSLATRSFSATFWSGSTTDATANVELFLNGEANTRFTISASTALVADIMLIANSTGAGKALSARRSVAIRRDGSNNTTLIGSVETNGTDQKTGSPTWSFTIDADDTNESLRIRVTGAASETVNWRAVAFYRVV